MYNIDEIMLMLDWNNSAEEQDKGLRLAANIKSINVFMQPLHPGCNKNVWGNCAKILCEKPDYLLSPYLMQLLEWIEDLNWPGALNILDRLKNYADIKSLCFAVNESTKKAVALNNQIWLGNLCELLDNENLKVKLSGDTLDELKKYYNN